jgi:TRAP-type C4-dicarboxylate transport system substrate-binding protein
MPDFPKSVPTPTRPAAWLQLRRAAALLLGLLSSTLAPAQDAVVRTEAPLRVVGGLASINQYVRHEQPFWTRDLPRLSQGRFHAEIVPFDRAGIRGQEMLGLVRLGTVPFGTLLLSVSGTREIEIAAPDLPGLNPDMATLRRSVAAFRPHLQQLLRERHGVELLAIYSYPAQVLFCRQPLASLADLKGRRVRTSSLPQSDFVEALGGQPLSTPFADIVPNLKNGSLDCAITGTMSGNTIGLHEHTTSLHTMPVSWGLSAFVAHRPTWQALPQDLRALLQRELPQLEQAIWLEADRETAEGLACNAGLDGCRNGRPGHMKLALASPADDALRRELLARQVLPRWLQRCGPSCADIWNRTLAPVAGVHAPAP